MKLFVLGAATELGLETVRQAAAAGHEVLGGCARGRRAEKVAAAGARPVEVGPLDAASLISALGPAEPDAVLNLEPGRANTLLHDGQLFKGQERWLQRSTAALVAALARQREPLLVHASAALVYGDRLLAREADPTEGAALGGVAAAFEAAERELLAGAARVAVLRLGYLYGPQLADVAAYRRSFRRLRPYYAGPPGRAKPWLHVEDAARALLLAAGCPECAGRVSNVAGTDAPAFGTVIDRFARRLGWPVRPPHLPRGALRFLGGQITAEQVRLLDLSTSVDSSGFRAATGWVPEFESVAAGMEQTVRAIGRHI